MSLQAGTKLGPYEILATLGAGGMGEVYRARDSRLDREVAIKVLPPHLAQDPSALKRFEREAKAIAALSHPNILEIHDFGVDHGVSYVVTELLEGENLRAKIKSSALVWQKALEIAIAVAQGMAAAHSKGVVHRDLKPENIFITADERVKILDFGLAKKDLPISQAEESELPTNSIATQPGMILGTIPYMSPEQLRGGMVDARSDIFSFGCVLYEMVSGKRAFSGSSPADIVTAVLKEQPQRISTFQIPNELQDVIKQCLAKDPDQRFSSMDELVEALHTFHVEVSRPHVNLRKELSRNVRRPAVVIPLVLIIAFAVFGLFRIQQKREKVRWAREEAIPKVSSLIEAEDFAKAVRLARQAQEHIPNDPILMKLWPQMSRLVTVHTLPEDTAVYIREYNSREADWENIGRSPLDRVRIPLGMFRWKLQKEGYQTVEFTERFPYISPQKIVTVNYTMEKEGSIPAGMIRVPGEQFQLQMPGLDHLPAVALDDYFIDRYEVTNKQFSEFVKSGGYQNKQYWKNKFIKDGRELSWEEGILELRDNTGRPGPATWEAGNYPKGQENFPVTGVSWYEAAAYAEFVGKSLPSVYHWNRAAGTWDSSYVIPKSNFGRNNLLPVGSMPAMHRYGGYDMAGNAKEWCWNESGNNRFILGGAWNEPTYMFNDPDAQGPFQRLPTYGFRCVKYLTPVAKEAMARIDWATRDFRTEKPVSDEIFQIYKSLYSYDKTELRSVVESVDNTPENWRKEKITFDAGYANERLIVYLFVPKNIPPPYQTVIYFPGSGVIYLRSPEQLDDDLNMTRIDFVIQSGRAVLFPIYEGTFGRESGIGSDYPTATSSYRDHVIHWHKELARSIDYLETRKDIDASRLAFYGASWGGALGMILPALEPRLKTNILLVGGFYLQKTLPEVDQINFVSRITIPTLMLNGRYDFFLPIETAQLPAFQLLGTPQKDKRQVIYETGHNIPRSEMIREVLNWLDRYLGPVSS